MARKIIPFRIRVNSASFFNVASAVSMYGRLHAEMDARQHQMPK